MCTCCITWWPRHPVFCWIEHSRHSRAVVGYVTSWAHACLSVSCGVSRGTTGTPSKLRSTLSTLLLPRGCDLCAPPQPPPSSLLFFFFFLCLLSPSPALCPPACQGRRPFWWHSGLGVQFSFCLSAWADHTQVQLLCCSGLCRCANDLFRFFQQHFTAHPAAAASVYIMSDYIFLADFTDAYEN